MSERQITPHNPYKDEINFSQLALQDADFAKVLVLICSWISWAVKILNISLVWSLMDS